MGTGRDRNHDGWRLDNSPIAGRCRSDLRLCTVSTSGGIRVRPCRTCGKRIVHNPNCAALRSRRESEKQELSRKKQRGKRVVEKDAPGHQSRIDWNGSPRQQLRHWRNSVQEQSSQDRSQSALEAPPTDVGNPTKGL